jgi:GNAT superfamily N-acetyltransferase
MEPRSVARRAALTHESARHAKPLDCSGFAVESAALRLAARRVPWDSEIYGVNVAQIDALQVLDGIAARKDYAEFGRWCKANRIRMVSCRLPHAQLRESMFLEEHGFRFIEMVLHPRIAVSGVGATAEVGLLVAKAAEADVGGLVNLAERAFGYERYHVDPRLDPRLADSRYGRWVANSLRHESQQLLKVCDADRLVALFLVEERPPDAVYWHLTAISPDCQGQGYGYRVWTTMLRKHKMDGFANVSTTISARNVPVLNLYAKLQFRFDPPEMTFHWLQK